MKKFEDPWQINFSVFGPGVIAVDQKGQQGQKQNNDRRLESQTWALPGENFRAGTLPALESTATEMSGPESEFTPAFDRLQPIRGTDLTQHPAQMVLDGLLGEIELAGNFLVGQAFADQLHQLLFSACEPKILPD